MDQKNDSLEEWYQKQVGLYGRKEAERLRSRLEVTKSYRRYNDPGRLMPGAVFLFRGKRYVLQSRITNGAYFKAVGEPKMNISARDCKILKQNEGLVFLA